MENDESPDRLMRPGEAAALLDKSENALAIWRSKKMGPPYVKIEGSIRYSQNDLMDWIDERKVRAS